MIDQPTIDRILDAAQIYDVVSDFVTLRKRGVNYVGLCPFHDDKTPSFYVSPAKGLCKCFACGKGGNAVHFIMEHEQMSYPEALKYLAKKYGIEIKERELSSEEKIAQSERESLFIVNNFARDYFQKGMIINTKDITYDFADNYSTVVPAYDKYKTSTDPKSNLLDGMFMQNAFSNSKTGAGYNKGALNIGGEGETQIKFGDNHNKNEATSLRLTSSSRVLGLSVQ